MSYHEQKEEAKPYIEAFKTERMPRYLAHFERILGGNAAGEVFFIGSRVTHIDFQVMVMLQVTASQFPDAWPHLEIPLLKAFLARMEARPNMQRYFNSQRKKPFA